MHKTRTPYPIAKGNICFTRFIHVADRSRFRGVQPVRIHGVQSLGDASGYTTTIIYNEKRGAGGTEFWLCRGRY